LGGGVSKQQPILFSVLCISSASVMDEMVIRWALALKVERTSKGAAFQDIDNDIGVKKIAQHQRSSRSPWVWEVRSGKKPSLTTGPFKKKRSHG